MYPGKMNLPVQLICFPSAAASCLPIATRSILSPLIVTVAFGKTLPSAGLITVAPTREILSACSVAVNDKNAITSVIRRFILEISPSLRIKLRRGNPECFRRRNDKALFFRFWYRFLGGFETDFGVRAVAKRFLSGRAATAERHPFFHGKFASVSIYQFYFAGHDVRAVPDCL